MGRRGKTKVSQTAQVGIDLQNALPNARVLYASATGATEPENLPYATRLGLWGANTSFVDAMDFVTQVSAGGVATMELVARDMKAMGVYMSRSLSFQGVEYDRLIHPLTEDQISTYNAMARAWQYTLRNIEAALQALYGDKPDAKAKNAAMSAYWSTQQRFFSAILTTMGIPSVIEAIEKDLAAGESCVCQLVNTWQAAMDRGINSLGDEDDIEDIEITPKQQLIQMVENCFPVNAMESYVDQATGKDKFRPVMDSKGNKVQDAEAVALRDNLLAELSTVRCPEGPLELLINHFGHKNVAEVTGRSRRIVRVRENGSEKTIIESRSKAKCEAEAKEFQDGKRRILIFSDAGGTGQSYHADAKAINQQRRKHYLIQAGWKADQAVQGFGRTHRSRQVSAPMYRLVTTDVPSQARFTSTIARRLDQLGALTRGERQAASTGILKAADNLESTWARKALVRLFKDMFEGTVEGISLHEFECQTGLELTNEKDGSLKAELPQISRFLNRLLSLELDAQRVIFNAFDERLKEILRKAEIEGTLDLGTEVVRAEKAEKVSETVIHTDPSGAETKLVEFNLLWKTKPRSFDAVMAGREAVSFSRIEFFALNQQSGHLYAFALASDRTDKYGTVIPHYTQYGPTTRRSIPQRDIRYGGNWVRLETGSEPDMIEARKIWDQQVAKCPEYETERMVMVCGAVLPVYSRLPQTGNVRVRRLQTVDGERFLGRVIEEEHLEETMKRLGVTAKVDNSPGAIAAKLESGTHAFDLANGWKLKPSRVSGERRIEVVGPTFGHLDSLRVIGVFFERIQFVGRWFIPTGPKATSVIEKLVSGKPIIESVRLDRAA